MDTLVTQDPEKAAEIIARGGVVAFPTETVYGLGADAFNETAVARIFEAKRRPSDNPLIAHVGKISQIEDLVAEVPAIAGTLIKRFFPGPLTLVMERSGRVPLIATAGLDTIGVRMPASPLAARFLRACGTPIVAPSANISGRPSPTTWQAVYEDLNGRIDCILQGEPTDIGLESTVVDCTSNPPLVLRPGSVTIEELQKAIPAIRAYEQNNGPAARSPGMLHKHYAPLARVLLVERGTHIPSGEGSAYIGIAAPQGSPAEILICSSVEEYARRVFAFFRECDAKGIASIYCQRVDEAGIGTALMDRLRRAEAA